ncbi:MAG: hypothetical protein WCE64_05795 [Bacteroidales bacterium]
MKKITTLVMLYSVMFLALQAQKVSNFTYQFDNGINVKMEQCWDHVWVSQTFEAAKTSDQNPPLVFNVRTLGSLTSGSTYKLLSSGKEVKLQGIKPGTYILKENFKLSGNPGSIAFDIDNVVIKPQTITTLSIVLYDYQIIKGEKAENHSGLSAYDSKVERYKGNQELNPSCGVLTFYEKGKHDKPVAPEGAAPSRSGDVKPGTYDVVITVGTAAQPQKIWLENFTMKPNVSYSITTNLNAGVIEYVGGNRDVKAIQLYPAGTADRQKGEAAPDKTLEIMKCENQVTANTCPPGTYDVLLNFKNGARYEWRKNIAVSTGSRVQVK